MVDADNKSIDIALTKDDVSAFLRYGYELVDQGRAGGCVPVADDDGRLVVAVMDAEINTVLYGLGRNHGGYFVRDRDGNALKVSDSRDDLLAALY